MDLLFGEWMEVAKAWSPYSRLPTFLLLRPFNLVANLRHLSTAITAQEDGGEVPEGRASTKRCSARSSSGPKLGTSPKHSKCAIARQTPREDCMCNSAQTTRRRGWGLVQIHP